MHIQESTLRQLRWPSSLSREENVLHAFLCYIDRLEVCGWRVDKERFYKKVICNILLLSLIPTKRNLLSTIFDGPPLSPERSCVLRRFLCNALSYACRQYENFEILYFTMRNTSMLMKSTRKACRNAPFWNNAGKLHR